MRGSPELLTGKSRLELIESASPVAFAEHPRFIRCMRNSNRSRSHLSIRQPVQPFYLQLIEAVLDFGEGLHFALPERQALSDQIVLLTVRILKTVYAGHAFRPAL
jgi:hypothetical protein